MEEAQAERYSLCVDLRGQRVVPRALEALELVFRPERDPRMRCPEEVRVKELLVRVLGLDVAQRTDEGLGELTQRVFDATEDVARELLIDRGAVAPARRSIDIIEELIETCHLGRLQGLV